MYWNTHSYYSLRYGTLSLEKLVEEAGKLKLEALGLTDINNTTGTLDFVRICREKGIRPLAGIEFRDGGKLLYTGLAANNAGFRELNEFLSLHNVDGMPLPSRPPRFDDPRTAARPRTSTTPLPWAASTSTRHRRTP